MRRILKKSVKIKRYGVVELRRIALRLCGSLALSGILLLVAINMFAFANLLMLNVFKPAQASPIHQEPLVVQSHNVAARKMLIKASAYSSRAYQTDSSPCVTADGTDVCERYFETQTIDTVAFNGLPFGTKIRIPKLFPNLIFIVRDRMNARYGSEQMDIWLPTRADAVQFGSRLVEVEILE